MSTTPTASVLARFGLAEHAESARPHGRGRIHSSWRIADRTGGPGWLLQRINTHVFADPAALMSNLSRVTGHWQSALHAQNVADPERRCLRILPGSDGSSFVQEDGEAWRVYHFIAGSVSVARPGNPAQARAAAQLLADFQRQAADLPGSPLHETIPHFHDTPRRLAALQAAVASSVDARRLSAAGVWVDFAAAREADANRFARAHAAGELPLRVLHNDPKLDNMLFDRESGEALCLVDLDTVMPGLLPYDIGDLVRSCAAEGDEQAAPDARIALDMEMIVALLGGYARAVRSFLQQGEIEALPHAPRIVALELGLRFLSDYLDGDRYFQAARADENLHRAMRQFRLVEALERQHAALQEIVSTAIR